MTMSLMTWLYYMYNVPDCPISVHMTDFNTWQGYYYWQELKTRRQYNVDMYCIEFTGFESIYRNIEIMTCEWLMDSSVEKKKPLDVARN